MWSEIADVLTRIYTFLWQIRDTRMVCSSSEIKNPLVFTITSKTVVTTL